MKNGSIKRRFAWLLIGLVLLVTAGTFVISYSALRAQDTSNRIENQYIPILNKAHELKLSVVQVQQFLTDISATRGLDGLNDGLEEAEVNAKQFRSLIQELRDLDPQNDEQYQQMLPIFEAYYATGQRMAHAYVEQGPAGGNPLMGEFDTVASNISDTVDGFVEETEKRVNTILETQVSEVQSGLVSVIAGALVLLVSIAIIYFIMNRTLVVLPRLTKELERVASGDLTSSTDIVELHSRNDEVGALCKVYKDMREHLTELVRSVTESSAGLVTASSNMINFTDTARRSMNHQQEEINQIATAVTEMSSSAREVASNGDETANSAREANEEAQSGMVEVNNTVDAISRLSAHIGQTSEVIRNLAQDSENIGGILEVIQGIADQTNLLALNAAIEAARAGEQGRGFAVVADEVRVLASRTQDSVREIQEMISRLQERAQSAVEVMQQSSSQTENSVVRSNAALQKLETITRSVRHITEMNTQIALASSQQSAVAEEVSKNINIISASTSEMAQETEQMATSGKQLELLANSLNAQITRFRI